MEDDKTTNTSRQRDADWNNCATTYLTQLTGFTITPRWHTTGQYKSACPFCKEGDDRFVIFVAGNYWCRKCNRKGFWRESSPAEAKAHAEAKEDEQAKKLIQISNCKDWIGFNAAVKTHLDLWADQFITEEDVAKWSLGYCAKAPISSVDSPSLTIPVFYGTRLVNIRHRLLQSTDDVRYTSHYPGLPATFFNADAIQCPGNKQIFYVEGEKKAIILMHYGITPVVAYPGLNTLSGLFDTILQHKHPDQEHIFIPDPDSIEKVHPQLKAFRQQGNAVSLLELIYKPDDMIRKYGFEPLAKSIPFRSRL